MMMMCLRDAGDGLGARGRNPSPGTWRESERGRGFIRTGLCWRPCVARGGGDATGIAQRPPVAGEENRDPRSRLVYVVHRYMCDLGGE